LYIQSVAIEVGIAGASGYVGAELLRLCAGHPELDLKVASSHSKGGTQIGSVYPSLAAAYRDLALSRGEPSEFKGVDVCFLALPHGESQRVVGELAGSVGLVVDLAADFRLQDLGIYEEWYGKSHVAPELVPGFVYGLPELFRATLTDAKKIAAPGCYPTAASLAIAPFVRAGAVETSGIVVDAASGVSGAGHSLTEASHFATVDENFNAYGLLTTCYMRPSGGSVSSTESAIEVLKSAYHGDPFIVVSEDSPSTKSTVGSNSAHLTARYDSRTGWLIALCAIDNLMKGAAGQAVQCANIALGLEETTGLALAGMYP
jgi:N-acetyl-gamma-glutamyl-phosphate reductase